MRMSTELDLAKLKVNKLYLLPSGTLCKIHKVDWVHGKVFIYKYNDGNDAIDIELAPRILTPAFKIGDVATMLQKSTETLRRYEREGLIDSPKRYQVGTKAIRIYTIQDIHKLIRFFETRRPVGRPSTNNKSFGVNKTEVRRKLKTRFEEIKNKI